LLAILVIAAGVALFLGLAREVTDGKTLGLDEALLLALRNPADRGDPLGPPWVEEMMRDVTALGGAAILLLVTAGVAIYLLLARRFTLAGLVVMAVAGGALLNVLLKAGYARPRPDLVPHYAEVLSASFPSGHSQLAATVYLTLGVLLARLQTRRRMDIYVLGVAVLLTVLVGVSRVYLGVHWPTDVVAGWAVGTAWAALCALAVWGARRRWPR
jgi:undecaprenyl-diphosphatase